MSNKANTVRSYTVQTLKKFPTIAFEISFLQIQNEQDIEARNLVSKVLPQAVASFPTKIATKSYFSDLYAAKVYSGVKRNGDKHEVVFQFIFTDPEAVQDEQYQLDDIILCIKRVLLEPALEQGLFIDKIMKVEKQVMCSRIANMYDDKSTYAQLQLLEHMFAGTPFAIRPYGKVENYEKVTAQQLFDTYQKMLTNDNMSIAVVGDVSEQLVIEKLNNIFADLQIDAKPLSEAHFAFAHRNQPQQFTEKQTLNQTKLHIGYRIPVNVYAGDYFKHRLAIEILGGGAQSKLFQNVREKASLAYYVSAVMDLYAESMYIYAGIDHEKIEAAHQIISEQIVMMQTGNITEEELLMAKSNSLHRLSMLQDNPMGMISLQKQLAELKAVNTIAEWEAAIQSITIDDVMESAKTWEEDTVFVLTNDAKEDEA